MNMVIVHRLHRLIGWSLYTQENSPGKCSLYRRCGAYFVWIPSPWWGNSESRLSTAQISHDKFLASWDMSSRGYSCVWVQIPLGLGSWFLFGTWGRDAFRRVGHGWTSWCLNFLQIGPGRIQKCPSWAAQASILIHFTGLSLSQSVSVGLSDSSRLQVKK